MESSMVFENDFPVDLMIYLAAKTATSQAQTSAYIFLTISSTWYAFAGNRCCFQKRHRELPLFFPAIEA